MRRKERWLPEVAGDETKVAEEVAGGEKPEEEAICSYPAIELHHPTCRLRRVARGIAHQLGRQPSGLASPPAARGQLRGAHGKQLFAWHSRG